MKKMLFVSLMAAAAVSCTNDDPAVEPVSRTVFNGVISSSEYAVVDLGTRATADEGLVKFKAGEQIGLGGDVLQYSAFTAADNGAVSALTGAVAPVWGQTPGKFRFWAVAPYVADAASGEFTVSIPVAQTIVDGENTTSIVLVGRGEAEYDGMTDPESVDISFSPCNPMLELSIPGSGLRLSKIEIEPVSEQDMTGGFGFEARVSAAGTVSGKSEGKSMTVDFRTGQNNYMTLTGRSVVKLPVGEFTIVAGEGLKFTFTMDDGTVRIRTVALEEDLSSTDVDNGTVIYKHLKLAFETLDQTINIFTETFGEPKDATLIVKNTKQRQLVNYFDGFTP
ncbi:MAG: fimbrillin family protein, partial [Alistipes sp.]|nr:fimbrillin family protein [Alistipes sp.]